MCNSNVFFGLYNFKILHSWKSIDYRSYGIHSLVTHLTSVNCFPWWQGLTVAWVHFCYPGSMKEYCVKCRQSWERLTSQAHFLQRLSYHLKWNHCYVRTVLYLLVPVLFSQLSFDTQSWWVLLSWDGYFHARQFVQKPRSICWVPTVCQEWGGR